MPDAIPPAPTDPTPAPAPAPAAPSSPAPPPAAVVVLDGKRTEREIELETENENLRGNLRKAQTDAAYAQDKARQLEEIQKAAIVPPAPPKSKRIPCTFFDVED